MSEIRKQPHLLSIRQYYIQLDSFISQYINQATEKILAENFAPKQRFQSVAPLIGLSLFKPPETKNVDLSAFV